MQRRRLLGLGAGMVLIASVALLGAKKYTAPPEYFQAPDDCDFCHSEYVERARTFQGHGTGCFMCHTRARTGFGAGHMTKASCETCHNETWPTSQPHGHPPALWATFGTPEERTANCATCHNPHGTPNLSMVRDLLTTLDGTPVDVSFLNEDGQADDSFVELPSASGGQNGKEPGQGLCEVCHTQTNHYRRDGTGAAHFTSNCVLCHEHTKSFAPPGM